MTGGNVLTGGSGEVLSMRVAWCVCMCVCRCVFKGLSVIV